MANAIVYLALACTLAVLTGFYLSWRATRLDRLHTRVETAQAALDAALLRRGAVALELAACGLLDPAASLLLADAAHQARSASGAQRERAEGDLSKALRAVLEQPEVRRALAAAGPGGDELVTEIDTAANGVVIARRFHGGAVRLTLSARRRWLGRLLHLAGSAALPGYVEFDDVPPGRHAQGRD